MNSCKVKYIFVDVQGFKDTQNNFIIKELAILNQENTQTFLVKPPYPFQYLSIEEKKQVRWIEANRGYFWSEGYIDYREFRRIIIPYLNKKKVLTKGTEKIKWIKDLCENCEIINVGEKGCPNFLKLYNDYEKPNVNLNCVHHKKMCALKNILCLKKWYDDNNIHLFNLS